MIMHATHHLLLHGTDVYHYPAAFPALLLIDVEHLREHLHRRSHGHREYGDVAFPHGVSEFGEPVGKAHLERRLRIDAFVLHAHYLIGEMPAPEVYGHRASDEAESYYSYFHNTFFINS